MRCVSLPLSRCLEVEVCVCVRRSHACTCTVRFPSPKYDDLPSHIQRRLIECTHAADVAGTAVACLLMAGAVTLRVKGRWPVRAGRAHTHVACAAHYFRSHATVPHGNVRSSRCGDDNVCRLSARAQCRHAVERMATLRT
jgi:hypothetical protein